ncbi:pentapeptide repeat-containing protein [Dactylosporangium sp. McL0621]|uniref:pentapeptide repeat-containing protein n=1 Tax=Dactylosporangium sp. McL0621 TaxID=3415678 RepID=UPI003CE7DB6D
MRSPKRWWIERRAAASAEKPVVADDVPLRPMPFWPVMTVVVLVVLAGGGLAMWLLGVWAPLPKSVANPESLRLDRIKTGLTVAAGLAAGATLLMTLRRQTLSERAQREAEKAQRFAEAAQRFAEADALEQRTTALYVAAADQLASDKAAVRLAGLYALERLGQDDPKLRQTVVDVWCAYLRMPFEPPADVLRRNVEGSPAYRAADVEVADRAEDAQRRQELEVRRTAQRLLTTHLAIGVDPQALNGRYWLGGDDARLDVDLTGAVLVNLFLDGCALNNVNLAEAQFHGFADLGGAQFHGVADLGRAQFHGFANLNEAQFHGDANLDGAQFHGVASLDGAQFHGISYLSGAQFHDVASLDEAQFHGISYLSGAQFHDGVHLHGAQFHGGVHLRRAQFHGVANLDGAQFHGVANLDGAQFHGDANLGGAQFHRGANLVGAQFHRGANLGGAQFHGDVDLVGAQFHDGVDLDGAEFHGVANLAGAKFHRVAHLGGAWATPKVRLPVGWELANRPASAEGLYLVVEASGPAEPAGDQNEPDTGPPEENET